MFLLTAKPGKIGSFGAFFGRKWRQYLENAYTKWLLLEDVRGFFGSIEFKVVWKETLCLFAIQSSSFFEQTLFLSIIQSKVKQIWSKMYICWFVRCRLPRKVQDSSAVYKMFNTYYTLKTCQYIVIYLCREGMTKPFQ